VSTTDPRPKSLHDSPPSLTSHAEAATPVDLTSCDAEPIHIPGSIQPHGVLLALTEPDLRVVQTSSNTLDHFGIAPSAVLGATLADLLDADGLAAVRSAAANASARRAGALPIAVRGRAFDGILHYVHGLLVLELEPALALSTAPDAGDDFQSLASRYVYRLQEVQTFEDLWPTLATSIAELSGFDRVMIYRFDEHDGSGVVIAEHKQPDQEAFFGLHYPASDIPQQARRLYVRNRLRLIGDAAYRPSPIVPTDNPLTGQPLDLSDSVLRSVSPIHCEYLRNMGVRASMSVSLVKDEQLWGLIACHHREPRFVPYAVRMLCHFLGDVVSWTLGSRLAYAESGDRARADGTLGQLTRKLATEPALAPALTQGATTALDLIDAGGFALAYEGSLTTCGVTPSPEQIEALLRWLEATMTGTVFSTHALPAAYPPSLAFKAEASGVLAVAVSRAQRVFLLWFRPEAVHEVHWAGDPAKVALPGAVRLSPRGSFELWKQTVHERSRRWATWETEAALGLRSVTATLVLQRAAELFNLNVELRRAVESRDDFLSMASHELRTPTTTLRLQFEALRRLAGRGPIASEQLLLRLVKSERQVDRLEQLINQLLDVSRLAAGRLDLEPSTFDLGELAREVVDRFDEVGVPIHIEASGNLTGHWDRFRVDQVLTNLLGNAIKYGRSAPVNLVLRGEIDRVRCVVRDQGIGISPGAQTKIFERFERAAPLAKFAGFGLGLWITRQILLRHGTDISVVSKIDEGSAFTFELPRSSLPKT
jgi:two-component system, chemotaxis family, sensor kinase Cph1